MRFALLIGGPYHDKPFVFPDECTLVIIDEPWRTVYAWGYDERPNMVEDLTMRRQGEISLLHHVYRLKADGMFVYEGAQHHVSPMRYDDD